MNQRKVSQFRCQIDPMIGPKPANAFQMGDGAGQLPGEAYLTAVGVHVYHHYRPKLGGELVVTEHIVPYANLQSIKLIPEEKKGPGRPAKEIVNG